MLNFEKFKLRPRMLCRTMVTLLLSVSLAAAGRAQDGKAKPEVSKLPLTTEQILVYRAVVNDYVKEAQGSLNISSKTEPAELTEDSPDNACAKEIGFKPETRSVRAIHRLDKAFGVNRRFVVVDPDQQARKVEENDPQKLVKRTIEGEEKVSNQELDDPVKQGFGTALFSLTEIIFDKTHHYALVAYSFWCGSLCGNGSTMILKKTGKGWRVSKVCGSWIS